MINSPSPDTGVCEATCCLFSVVFTCLYQKHFKESTNSFPRCTALTEHSPHVLAGILLKEKTKIAIYTLITVHPSNMKGNDLLNNSGLIEA